MWSRLAGESDVCVWEKKVLVQDRRTLKIRHGLPNRLRVFEPEVWFRILHVAPDGHNGASAARYREQTVEIALMPRCRSESRRQCAPSLNYAQVY